MGGRGSAGPAGTTSVAHEVQTENRIRAAYRDLATGPNRYVRLADLKAHMSGVSHEDFKTALIQGARRGDWVLTPEEDRRRLRPADKAAAVRFGGMPTHYLSIENPSPRRSPGK